MKARTALNAAAHAVSVVALSFGLSAAANDAQAADQCLPGVYNSERGIKAKDCYTTAEMNRAMQLLGQRSLIRGDRIALGDNAKGEVVTEGRVNLFTSNHDGSLGFNVEGDAPNGSPQKQFYVGAAYTDIRLYDRDAKIIPSSDIVGPLHARGIQNSGDRLMMSARSGIANFVVVARGDTPTVGSFLIANSEKGAGLAGMKNLAYTELGQSLLKDQKHASAIVGEGRQVALSVTPR